MNTSCNSSYLSPMDVVLPPASHSGKNHCPCYCKSSCSTSSVLPPQSDGPSSILGLLRVVWTDCCAFTAHLEWKERILQRYYTAVISQRSRTILLAMKDFTVSARPEKNMQFHSTLIFPGVWWFIKATATHLSWTTPLGFVY